jgi:hypothetical protein
MIARAIFSVLFAAAATTASAQTKAPTTPATKAPATKTADTTKAGTKAATSAAKAPASANAPQGATKGTGRPGLAVTPEQPPRPRTPVIMREVFDYDSEGRRDPFFSLLTTAELRPTVTDLRLVGILYDPTGRRSVVTLRDLTTNARYQVTTGTTLGRMKVVLIKPKAVYFTIEEFGLNRQDSLVLGDTTKARAR